MAFQKEVLPESGNVFFLLKVNPVTFILFSYFSDGKAFTRRPGRESTWRSERISSGGIFCKRKNCKKKMLKIQQLYLHTGAHPRDWTLLSQGALAVLKQFLESNLVRTTFHLRCLQLLLVVWNLIWYFPGTREQQICLSLWRHENI